MRSSREETLQLLRLDSEIQAILAEARRREAHRKWLAYFPETGPLRRELYPKHMEFFGAGATYRQRLMLAANRVGKTESVGLYELMLHLTGRYPAWWHGRRFDRPIKAWVAGDTSETVRDILQLKLMGPVGSWGTGVMPGDAIGRITRASGIGDAIDTLHVKNVHGGDSVLVFKSYDQRRKAFQGTEQDVILLDEEPPMDIYTECLLRTMTVDGMVMLTFTPLSGMSEVVLAFLPDGDVANHLGASKGGGKYVVTASWDDVPHLTEQAKRDLLSSIPPFQRDARSKGIPQLGAGAIYPVPESEIVVPVFAIPKHWPRGYGLDVGWNRTAGIFVAEDRETDTLYAYSEHYRGEAEPSVHASAIKARGSWLEGAIDPAARGRSQKDGEQLLQQYRDLALNLSLANNGVESGIYEAWERFSTGRLKLFNTLANTIAEYRLYRRDDKGRVVKAKDHAMDALRYVVNTRSVLQVQPAARESWRDRLRGSNHHSTDGLTSQAA